MWTIIVRDGQGKEVAQAELKDGVLTLGREKGCGLVLPSSAVSRKHARFELRGDQLFFVDEGSANGSIVDGRRVAAPVELSARSVIEIAPFRIAALGGAADDMEKTVIFKQPLPAPRPPSPVPAAAPPPAGAAFTVRFPEPAATPKTAAPKPQDESDAASAELQKHIEGIRSYREQASSNTQSRQNQLDQGWTALMGAMRTVAARLAANPRVQSFGFSRDGKEVTIKIQDAREKRGYRYFTMSRSHPLGKFPGVDAVWICETGRDELSFRDAKEAQTEIFQRIAATLA